MISLVEIYVSNYGVTRIEDMTRDDLIAAVKEMTRERDRLRAELNRVTGGNETMSNKDETYNGWTNRATWHTNLVISNEYSSYQYWSEQAKYYAESAPRVLAEAMQQEIGRAHVPDDCAKQSINWLEIASTWHEEAREALELDDDLHT